MVDGGAEKGGQGMACAWIGPALGEGRKVTFRSYTDAPSVISGVAVFGAWRMMNTREYGIRVSG
jgi:hypothetical protein